MRGATLVQEIRPNVGEVSTMSGSQNCGWLKALKNSARNSSEEFSRGRRKANLFARDKSKLSCPGPVKIPTPELPKPNASGSSALNTAGCAKQLALMYALRFKLAEPGVR